MRLIRRVLLVAVAAAAVLCSFPVMAGDAFAVAPEVSTQPATGVTLNGSATLNGMVNPNGLAVTSCVFEYGEGETGPFEHTVECSPEAAVLGSGTTSVPVSAELTGLIADTLYHYRLTAANAEAEAHSNEEPNEKTLFYTDEPVFGFQLQGPNALEMIVSNEAESSEPSAGNPATPDTQAGSHPFDVTTRLLINTESDRSLPLNLSPKDYYVNIPAGFAGSVAKVPRCKINELSDLTGRWDPAGCATASQVGVIRVFRGLKSGEFKSVLFPVYNVVPPPGVPAELAFPYIEVAEPIVFQLRPDDEYGVTAEVRNLSEAAQIMGSQLTLWGVPASTAHDAERFLPTEGTGVGIPGNEEGKPLPAGTAEVPFLTNPTRCGEQPEATIFADSWLHPGALGENGRPDVGAGNWVTQNVQMFPGGITGCEKLAFNPEINVKLTTTVADLPAGATVTLKVPQSENPHNLATPALKSATVTLPAGLAVSASQANGLEGCTPEQIAIGSTRAPSCPNGSQVGRLEVVTPLLPEPLTGEVYLSSEHSGNTFHVYLVIEGQGELAKGVLVKLKGTVVANEQTGQLETKFDKNPQLPFSELKLTLYGGPGAALATPTECGPSYKTTSLLEPWSHLPAPGEEHGTPDASPISSFAITSGCNLGFSPGFKAGTTKPVAGSYSPLTVLVSRNDGEQEVSGVQIKLPEGLIGKLAGITECSSAQIAAAELNSGTAEKASSSCPASSQVATVQGGAGPGETPFYVPGKAYLTGPYKGAPYGLAVIVPALAGPFDLGTVVVRATINVDPHTAQVTITSDPLPRMLDGVPLRLRRIYATANRPNFTLNPTICNRAQIIGMISSFQGASHPVASRFQVGDCTNLTFKPGFHVATKAKHTRKNGESLRVNVTSGKGQANIKSVYVELPKALPSRLETLKLACSAKQFEANPAGCPAASHVGTAVAHTPLLAVPLTGPAIFVSHGGAAFPDLDIVLQGAGITVDLTGNTNIKRGITSSSFKTVPDVPVNTFQLTLPMGAHSALDANGNLCTITTHKHTHHRTLIMPTTITAQNGMIIKRNTIIDVEGCKKASFKHGNKHKH